MRLLPWSAVKNDGSTKDQLKKELPDGSAEIPPF